MHRGSVTLLQRAATHLSGIFLGIFSTIEKDTTKPLGLRGIRVPEPTSRLQPRGDWCEWLNKIGIYLHMLFLSFLLVELVAMVSLCFLILNMQATRFS